MARDTNLYPQYLPFAIVNQEQNITIEELTEADFLIGRTKIRNQLDFCKICHKVQNQSIKSSPQETSKKYCFIKLYKQKYISVADCIQRKS